MRWALAALWLSLPALAEPSARLLPREAPPAAIDFSGSRTLVVSGIAVGAVLTAIALSVAVALTSQQPFHDVARPPLR